MSLLLAVALIAGFAAINAASEKFQTRNAIPRTIGLLAGGATTGLISAFIFGSWHFAGTPGGTRRRRYGGPRWMAMGTVAGRNPRHTHRLDPAPPAGSDHLRRITLVKRCGPDLVPDPGNSPTGEGASHSNAQLGNPYTPRAVTASRLGHQTRKGHE